MAKKSSSKSSRVPLRSGAPSGKQSAPMKQPTAPPSSPTQGALQARLRRLEHENTELKNRLGKLNKTTLGKERERLLKEKGELSLEVLKLKREIQDHQKATRDAKTVGDAYCNKAVELGDALEQATKDIKALKARLDEETARYEASKLTAEQLAEWQREKAEHGLVHSEASRENIELRRTKARLKLGIAEVIADLVHIQKDETAAQAIGKLRKMIQ